MENPTLAEGATFGDIATAPENVSDGEQPTPDTGTEAEAATDGGTPPESKEEGEVLGILKEETPEEPEDENVDLSLDPDLEKHPILKAKWEAYKAQKEKGIDKWMSEQSKKYDGLKESHDKATEALQAFAKLGHKDHVDAAFKELCAELEEVHGRPFGKSQATPADADKSESADAEFNPDPQSRYKLEFASEDKIVDTAVDLTLQKVEKLLDQRLGPIAKKFETDAQTEKLTSDALAVLPALQAKMEVSAEPWITKDMVVEAMREYPGIAPERAFRAKYADELVRYAVKHAASGRAQVARNLPTGSSGGKTLPDLRPGATFGEIAQAEAISLS